MSWTDRRTDYEKIAKAIEPSVRLTTKDGWFWRLLAFLLACVTFGRMPKQRFLNVFSTTIGPVISIPRCWPDVSAELLAHEARHARQARWFGLGIHPWAGLPLFAASYLMLPIPAVLAWVRFRLELDANLVGFRRVVENAVSAGASDESLALHLIRVASHRAESLSGPDYFWAWPKKWALKRYLGLAEKVLKERKP